MSPLQFHSTGEFYKSLVGVQADGIGEKVADLSWGGVVLEFEDGTCITFADSDVERVELRALVERNDNA